MTDYATTPETSGPAHDGSRSLARESRYGLTVTTLATILALAGADYLGTLDPSGVLPTWANGAVSLALGVAAGTLTAWATRNRPRALQLYRKS